MTGRFAVGMAGLVAAFAAMEWLWVMFWPWLVVLGALTGVAVAVGWRTRRTGSAGLVKRWSKRMRRREGVASTVDIIRVAGGLAMRRKATTVRPSLGALTRRQRRQLPTTAVAIPLCRVGALRVWSSVEDVVTVFGGPRTGKSGWLAGVIIDAPGAVLTTSTRLDLWEMTAGLRQQGGRSVWVFNPGGIAQRLEPGCEPVPIPSTVAFDPLHGCKNPITATERGMDMIPEAAGNDGERWDAKGRRYLAVLLHAAALADLSCATVAEWIANLEGSRREILSALRRSPDPSFTTAAQLLLGLNDKTQTSITEAIMPAFSWLASPPAVAATIGGHQLNVAELLQQRGTVYLLGRHEAHTAPLLAALTGHIAREARRLAACQPGGRLDPPLTLTLDEAARIAPVPLPDWSGDFGGSGLCIVAAFQSRADMINRWGVAGAAVILNNSGSVVLFGGTKDAADLDVWSKLAGTRDETVPGSAQPRVVPVLSVAQLANLPTNRVVVFHRGMPPVIGLVRMAWTRRDVQAQLRSNTRVKSSQVGDFSQRVRLGGADGSDTQPADLPVGNSPTATPPLPSPTPVLNGRASHLPDRNED